MALPTQWGLTVNSRNQGKPTACEHARKYETRTRGAVAIEASGYDQLLYELDTNLYASTICSDGSKVCVPYVDWAKVIRL
jgi:hypothetical protein